MTLAALGRSLRRARVQRRGLAVALNALNSMAVPLIGPLFAFVVVRVASVDLWGDYVRALIAAQLAAHVAGWGNKDYLLREFSRQPGRVAAAWQTNLFTRLVILVVLPAVLLVLGLPPGRVVWLTLCALGLVLDQAFDVVVLYRRAFVTALAVEAAGLAVLAVPVVWLGSALTLDTLLMLFALSTLFKAALLGVCFRTLVAPHRAGRFDLRQLRAALPFFLLGFSGLLQSRADFYAVSAFLGEREIGHYQVFSTLMLYGQSVAGFILLPFVKGLYRLSFAASLRVAARLAAAGVVVLAGFLPAAHLALTWLYGLPSPPALLLIGGASVWPIFFYLPVIYALFKAQQPALVVLINVLGTVVSVVVNLALLPRFGLVGAAAGAAAAQWCMGLAYVIVAGSGRRYWVRASYAASVSDLPRNA